MRTLVIQSCSTGQAGGWMQQCLQSVRDWSRRQGFDYRLVGDEIFQLVPPWYMNKVAGKLPVATDYGRLVLLDEALTGQGYDQAIWFDADTLVFNGNLQLTYSGSCAFGQEVWVQKKTDGSYRASRNVHNAVCAFRRDCPTLPFLMATVLSIIRRIDAAHIAPQIVGPKLLTALHNIAGFDLLPEVGAFSPEVINDLIRGHGPALQMLVRKSQVTPFAANLCASLIDARSAARVITVLPQTRWER